MNSKNTMTISEFIDALKAFPSSATVYIYVPDSNRGHLGGFSYLNTVERGNDNTVVLSNEGIYMDICDHDESGLFEED